jgi:steroid 5-alpha reductase family enzyme
MFMQALFFVYAAIYKTDKVTDLTYSLTFIVIALYLMVNSNYEVVYWPQMVLSLMVIIWALRLGGYLFYRILKIKRDSRFDERRGDVLEFAKFWILQGVSVWAVTLPLQFYSELVIDKSLSWVPMGLGFAIWLVGLGIETIADLQKFKFKNKNPKKWVNVGLWKYARYPNYFGEMLVWWGIYIFTLSGIGNLVGIGTEVYILLTGLGPIYITLLLLFVSGIPILEKQHEEKYGDQKGFKEYKKNSNLLFPIPQKI